MAGTQHVRGRSLWLASLAAGVVMLALDLTWLGVVAHDFYHATLGPLARPEADATAARLFYGLYLWAIVRFAALDADFVAHAAGRGAVLGLIAYGTWDLTNWAVLRDWPARLVPVDMAWGVGLTAVVAAVARWVLERCEDGRR